MMGTDDYDTWQQFRLAPKTESEAECNAAAAGIVTFDSQIQGIVTCEDAVADEDPFFAEEEWWFDDEFCPGQATGGFPDTGTGGMGGSQVYGLTDWPDVIDCTEGRAITTCDVDVVNMIRNDIGLLWADDMTLAQALDPRGGPLGRTGLGRGAAVVEGESMIGTCIERRPMQPQT